MEAPVTNSQPSLDTIQKTLQIVHLRIGDHSESSSSQAFVASTTRPDFPALVARTSV